MINWLMTPVFLGLALINYMAAPPVCTAPGPLGFLTSMWVMYLLMAVAHAALWISMFHRGQGGKERASSPWRPLRNADPNRHCEPKPKQSRSKHLASGWIASSLRSLQ